MKSTEAKESNASQWLLGGGKLDEVEFCRAYYIERGLAYKDGAFFSAEGRIADEDLLRRDIYRILREHIRSGLGTKVENILAALRLECPDQGLEEKAEDLFTIPVANGTYRLDEQMFSPVKHLTRYRLPVNYNPDAPKPEKWLSFLRDLLSEEDIPTLQEFMGYCLIPTTIAQKMLIITGRGGEGKSRIGVVMKSLLGCNMTLNSIAKVEMNRFARADLEHMLVMVDDDLKMEGLKQTNYLKSIITAELPMDLEKKGIQSYQGRLFVRFMAFGNESLQALNDCSHGFFRRQIILTAKERSPDRQDDRFLANALVREKEGILLWCIEGLERLMINDFRFTLSRSAQKNLLESMYRGNNIPEFLRSEGYIRLDPGGSISSRQLNEIYRDWCSDNALSPQPASSFWGFLTQNLSTYHLQPSRSIPIGNGKYARGFQGIRALPRY